MSEVRFNLDDDYDPTIGSNLPVKVLDHEMTLVAETIAAKGVKLPVGRYVAQSVLPNGQPVQAAFQVRRRKSGVSELVTLQGFGSVLDASEAFDSPDEPSVDYRQLQIFSTLRRGMIVGGGFSGFSPSYDLLSKDEEGSPDAKLQLLAGNPLGPQQLVPIEIDVSQAVAEIEPGPQRVIRFMRPGKPTWSVCLPVSETEGVALEFRAGARDWFPHIRLPDPEFELLLQYVGASQVGELKQMADSTQLAHAGLAEKFEKPILSALGAYVLLSTGMIEGLHSWTTRLSDAFPNMPDGHAVAGEVAARLGQHETALDYFLRGTSAGVPVFTAGLRFMLDRLRSYAAAVKRGDLTTPMGGSPSAALERLQGLAGYADFDRPLVSFTTNLSGAPGSDVLDELDFANFDGAGIRFAL